LRDRAMNRTPGAYNALAQEYVQSLAHHSLEDVIAELTASKIAHRRAPFGPRYSGSIRSASPAMLVVFSHGVEAVLDRVRTVISLHGINLHDLAGLEDEKVA
jgi:hypothetical protein